MMEHCVALFYFENNFVVNICDENVTSWICFNYNFKRIWDYELLSYHANWSYYRLIHSHHIRDEVNGVCAVKMNICNTPTWLGFTCHTKYDCTTVRIDELKRLLSMYDRFWWFLLIMLSIKLLNSIWVWITVNKMELLTNVALGSFCRFNISVKFWPKLTTFLHSNSCSKYPHFLTQKYP